MFLETTGYSSKEWIKFIEFKYNYNSVIEKFKFGDSAILELCQFRDLNNIYQTPEVSPYIAVSVIKYPEDRKQNNTNRSFGAEMESNYRKYALPPFMQDIRELQWSGQMAQPRYTYLIDLPFNIERADKSIRKNVNKSKRAEFFTRKINLSDLAQVTKCIKDTEIRQGFRYKFNERDLEFLINTDHDDIVFYGAFIKNELASVRLMISSPNSTAVDVLAATRQEYLSSGATQLLIFDMLEVLTQKGSKKFDFCGANIKSIAHSKQKWGGHLTPFYIISRPSISDIFKRKHLVRLREWINLKR